MSKFRRILFLSFFATLTACIDPATVEISGTLGPLTTIYINGDIITMDPITPSAEAVAVREGKIFAVGSRTELESISGNHLKLVDLDGATLLPGLIDAHGHISYTSLYMGQVNVSSPPVGSAKRIDDVVSLLKAQVDKPGSDGWILGWGYDDSLLVDKRHPTREDLDKVSSTRPVAILHVSAHFMSCNSVCLELAGIDATSADPAGGIIQRIDGGKEPNGVLEESALASLVNGIIPHPDTPTRLALLQEAQRYYASFGITTVQDGGALADHIELLQEAANQGQLILDIVAFPYAQYMGKRLAEFPASQEYKNRFRIGGVKIGLDGSPQGKTAWLTKPYLQAPHGENDAYVGYASLKDEQVKAYVEQAFDSNTPLLAHANGDAAADQLIQVIANANEKFGKADRRSVMIHAQTVRDDQIDAMIEHDITPSYFSSHTFYWGDWHRDSVFGIERASRISPLRTSADKGLRYTTHNDTPVVPPDMMRLLWASINRTTRSGQVLGEEQKASPMEALKSITIDAAHQYFEEETKGSITVGKIADFVILDNNPLSVEPITIKDIKVLKTIKDGDVVFAR